MPNLFIEIFNPIFDFIFWLLCAILVPICSIYAWIATHYSQWVFSVLIYRIYLSNVPLDETILICADVLRFLDIVFVYLMKVPAKSASFIFNICMYRQNDGVVWGSPLGLLMANIFVGFHDKRLTRSLRLIIISVTLTIHLHRFFFYTEWSGIFFSIINYSPPFFEIYYGCYPFRMCRLREFRHDFSLGFIANPLFGIIP